MEHYIMIKCQSPGRNCDLKYVCIKEQSLEIYEAQSDNQKGEIRQIHTYNRELQHLSQQLIKLLSRK